MIHDRIETTHASTRRRALDTARVSAMTGTKGMAGGWPADELPKPGVHIVTEPLRGSPAVRVYAEADAGWASVALSPHNARRLAVALIEAAAVVDPEHRG